jgi:hypothetical protein
MSLIGNTNITPSNLITVITILLVNAATDRHGSWHIYNVVLIRINGVHPFLE